MIKERRELRKKMRDNTKNKTKFLYNKLTYNIKKSIKCYEERKWQLFTSFKVKTTIFR